jgi:uncharacterized protein (DUF1800 family)
MTRTLRTAIHATGLIAALAAGGAALAQKTGVPAAPDDRTIVHVLNRIGYGPAPGDAERVRKMGLDAYIASQLAPERIPDEALAARLAPLTTLTMSTRALAEEYFIPAMQERAARQRQQGMDAAQQSPGMTPPPARPEPATGERRVLLELNQQKLLRAIYSDRQLQEVMVDFWFNHFNVFAGKGQVRLYLTEYERDVIRPRVLGSFRDLLGAVAESPAMLFYLDNWQSSAAEDAETSMEMRPNRRRPLAPNLPAQNRRRGINENYARELMELHTLGVSGGYTQKDVQEIARAFTGWTIDVPRQGGGFRFDPRRHDDGEKVVLGVTIKRGGGKRDGEQVLDILAAHPATATFISTKLARRFVADDPPKALVERAAATFRSTGGNIREVVRTIVTSPEFFSGPAYRAKVKTPFEFVASAVRASGADVRNALPLAQSLRQLGMPLYGCEPPTGYADKAEAWVNTGALLNRMNFAVTLSSGRGLRGNAPGVDEERIEAEIMAGDVSANTRATVARATAESQKIALLLGSPDFQKR